MRLYFDLSPNTEPVPWDYQHFLIGAFHKWLGRNRLHDRVSLYSLSWLTGGQRKGGSLTFPKGAMWFVSCYEIDIAKRLLGSVLSDPEVCCGMRITGARLVEPPEFDGQQRFFVATPVLVRRFDGQSVKHLTFAENGADAVLTQTLQRKMKFAGLDEPKVAVEFDRTYPKARTKLVSIKGIHNKASLCPVIVRGSPRAAAFAWEVGIGHSTGSGFGALC